MSPLGLLLLSECDNDFRIDLKCLALRLSTLGVTLEKATIIAKILGLTVHTWLN